MVVRLYRERGTGGGRGGGTGGDKGDKKNPKKRNRKTVDRQGHVESFIGQLSVTTWPVRYPGGYMVITLKKGMFW